MAYYTSVGMPPQMSGNVRPSGSGTYLAEKNSGQPVNMFTQMPMCNLVPVLPVHQMGSYPPHLTAGGWRQSIIRLGPPPQMMGSQPLVTTVTYQAVNYGTTVPLEQVRPLSRERPDLMTAFTERAKKRGITIEPQHQMGQQHVSHTYSEEQQSSDSLENTPACLPLESQSAAVIGSHASITSPDINPQFYIYRDPTKSDSDVSLSVSDSDVDIGPNVIVRQSLNSSSGRRSNNPPSAFSELGASNNNNSDYNLSLAVAHLNATQNLEDGFLVTSFSDASVENSVLRSSESSASDVDVTGGRRSVSSSSSHNSRNSRKGIPPAQPKNRTKMSQVDGGRSPRTPPSVQRVMKDEGVLLERGLVSPVSDEMLESEFLTPTSHASSWATPRSAGTPVAGAAGTELASEDLDSLAYQFSPRFRQSRARCCDVGCQTPAVVTVSVSVGNLAPQCVDASTNTDITPTITTADAAVGSDPVDDYAADQNVATGPASKIYQSEAIEANVAAAIPEDEFQSNIAHRRSNSSGRNSITSGISGKGKTYADGEVQASVSATTDNLSWSPSGSNANTSSSPNSSAFCPSSPPVSSVLPPVARHNDVLFRIDEACAGVLLGDDRVVVEPLATASASGTSLGARQVSPLSLSRPSSRLECDTESLCVIPNCPFQHSRRVPPTATEHHEVTQLTGVEHHEVTQLTGLEHHEETQTSEPEPAQQSVTGNTLSDSSHSPRVPPGLEHIKELLLSDMVGALPLPRTQQTSSAGAADNSDMDDYIYYSDEDDDNIYVTTSRIADATAVNVIAALQTGSATPLTGNAAPAPEMQTEAVPLASTASPTHGPSSAVSVSLSNPPLVTPPVVAAAAAATVPTAATVPAAATMQAASPPDSLLPDEVLLVMRIMQEMLLVNPSLAAIPPLVLENEAIHMVLATRQQRMLNQQAAATAQLLQQQQQLLLQEQLLQQQQQMLQQQVVDDPVDLRDDRSSLSGIALPSTGSVMSEYIATTGAQLLSDHSDESSAPELPTYFQAHADSAVHDSDPIHPDSRTSSDRAAATRFKFHTHHNFDDSCSVVSAAESHVSRQAGRGRGRGVNNTNQDVVGVARPPPSLVGESQPRVSGGRGRGSRQLCKDPPPAAKPPTPVIPPLVPPGPGLSQSRSNSRHIQRQVAPSNEAWDDEIDESAPQLFTVDSSFFKTGVIKK